MFYITFNNHPGDLIKSHYSRNKIKSFLIIGNKLVPMLRIYFEGGNLFKVLCKFPANSIEQQYIISMLTKMLNEGEIVNFKL